VRTLRHKLGFRRGDPERHSFTFFVLGTLVVIAVAFFLGFQLGRYVEKNAWKEAAEKSNLRGTPGDNTSRIASAAEIRKDLSAFSAEALNVPAVAPPAAAPPTAGDELKKTESEATFPEALSRKDPSPMPMGRKAGKAGGTEGEAGFLLQAGAMKSLETAEAVRKRLGRAGYKARVIRSSTRKHRELYRVRVGPFGSRGEAMKAMKAIRALMKIDVILVKG